MDLSGAALLGANHVFDAESGEFINSKFQHIAEIINDWNPELFLLWIKPKDRAPGETHPYAIQHRPSNGNPPYIVKFVKEEELDHRLIAELWQMGEATKDINGYLDKLNAAQEAIRLKEQEEELLDTLDRMHSAFASPLHTYRLSKDKVIRS